VALTFISTTVSAAAAVATAVPVPYPASIVIGDPLVLLVGTKPFSATIATPAGWQALGEITNGSTAMGVDTGSVKMAAFARMAAGGESGNLTVTITSGDSSYGVMYRYTKAAGATAQFVAATGTDTTVGTAWSVTFGSNPGITTGDSIVVGGVYPTDAANTFSASALAATGATFAGISAAGHQNPRVTTGNDLGGNTNQCSCTAGPASAAPVWTATQTLATNNAGSAVVVRIRELQLPAARAPFVVGAQANRRASQWR
jgi:hypothetical protein